MVVGGWLRGYVVSNECLTCLLVSWWWFKSLVMGGLKAGVLIDKYAVYCQQRT